MVDIIGRLLRLAEHRGFQRPNGSTPEQVGEIYELRGLLEANAARACAEQSTPELVRQLRENYPRIWKRFARKKESTLPWKSTTNWDSC